VCVFFFWEEEVDQLRTNPKNGNCAKSVQANKTPKNPQERDVIYTGGERVTKSEKVA
jgi:hypothetical protein